MCCWEKFPVEWGGGTSRFYEWDGAPRTYIAECASACSGAVSLSDGSLFIGARAPLCDNPGAHCGVLWCRSCMALRTSLCTGAPVALPLSPLPRPPHIMLDALVELGRLVDHAVCGGPSEPPLGHQRQAPASPSSSPPGAARRPSTGPRRPTARPPPTPYGGPWRARQGRGVGG